MVVPETSPPPLRVLLPDGSLAPDQEPRLSDDELLEAYRLMLLARRFDEKAVSLQRQGRLGTLSTALGQEAAIVGAAMALDPARDWVVPQYRETAALIRQGLPLANVFCHYMGNPAGDAIPEGVRMLPVQISLAAQLPHAVGLAWGLRQRGEDGVVLVFFGEGSSSEGDFHEACNLAGVVSAPVVFLLQNNGWAISTPRSKQTAAATFASRAAGYGMPGHLVDGNDLLAMTSVVRAAVERARAGDGPSLVEAMTYRLGAHSTADDPTRYVEPEQLERARDEDPMVRVRTLLGRRGLLDEDREVAMEAELRNEIAEALAVAEARPRGSIGDLLAHVYSRPPARLVKQLRDREDGPRA